MNADQGQRVRARELGIVIGSLPSGPTASLADVPGTGVGHATVWRDEPEPPAGRGTARTGVTVIDPGGNLFRRPVPAGGAVLNGAGECTGFIAAAEWGLAETPVFLTSTMQVGRVYDAACELLAAEDDGIGTDDVIIPIVAECDDSFLSDARRMQVGRADVAAALAAARAAGRDGRPPAEGAVGAGTGMSCLGFKGGIGSASRVVPSGHTVGALVLANYGDRERLTVDGVPVGRLLPAPRQPRSQSAAPEPAGKSPYDPQQAGRPAGPGRPARPAPGSCITVLVTDAPLDAAGCTRLARRAGLGLARTGSTAHHGSGEIFLALATGLRAGRPGLVPRPPGPAAPRPTAPGPAAPGPASPGLAAAPQPAAGPVIPVAGSALDPFFDAAVEATEEAVINCLLSARTVTGRGGNTSPALPAGQVLALLEAAGRRHRSGPQNAH